MRVTLSAVLFGSVFTFGTIAWANTPAPGTLIENQATGSFVDPGDNSTQLIESNVVQVTVAEVAGITVTAQTLTSTVSNGDLVNFEFTITNVGNDPTQFMIPRTYSAILLNGSAGGGSQEGDITIAEYDPDGTAGATSPTALNIAVTTESTTGNLTGFPNGGAISVGGHIRVQVPIRLASNLLDGDVVTLVFGDTATTDSQNEPYVAGSHDVYTQDNAGTNNGDTDGNPSNGEREASARQAVTVAIATPPTSGLTFACDTSAYSAIGTPSLFNIFDPVNLTFSPITTPTSPNFNPPVRLNGLAFNPQDDYIYAFVTNPQGQTGYRFREIVRISADGTLENLGRATLAGNPSVELNSGSFVNAVMDGRGNFYNLGDGTTLRVISIGNTPSAGSLTYQEVAITGLPAAPDDLNFNPVDGFLYGIKQGVLYRIPPTGGAATAVSTTGDPVPRNAGGSWATSSGISYFYKNVVGGTNALYAIDLTQSPAIVNEIGPVITNDQFDATACTPPSITKNVDTETALPGDTVTYTYVIYNGYGTDIIVNFDDILTDPNITFDTNSLSVASPGDGTITTFNDTQLSLSGITIPNGVDGITNSVTFTVDVIVSDTAPAGTIDNQATVTFGTANFLSDDPDTGAINDPTTFEVLLGQPDVLLVKRITALNADITTTNGNNLAAYIDQDDAIYPYDDNTLSPVSDPNNVAYDPNNPAFDPRETDQWPIPLSTYLVGGIDGGNVIPNDEIEYTIYFLSSGDTLAKDVLICDYVPEFTRFIPNTFNGLIPQASGGIIGADLSVEVLRDGSPAYYTGADDGDSAIYFDPGIDPASDFPGIDCDGDGIAGNANPNGAIVVNLGDITNASDATSVETESYGYVRFRAQVK